MIPTYKCPAYEPMKLTYQTDEYDFYRTFNNGNPNDFFTINNANVYKVVPKNSPVPTEGYVQPLLALGEFKIDLRVCICFNKPLPIINYVI